MHAHTHTHTHTRTHIPITFVSLLNFQRSSTIFNRFFEKKTCGKKGNTLSNLKRKGNGRREEGARTNVFGRGWVCGGVPTSFFVRVCVCVYVCVCVCVCVFVCVRARSFLFHTRKGALMLYTLYVQPTMGHLEAPMKRCTRGW